MGEIARRLVWFFIVSCVTSYLVFLIAGYAIEARASEERHFATIRDVLSPGAHHLSGMITVQSICSELSVRTEQTGPVEYRLIFKTWDEPNVDCPKTETPRAFRSVIFAPATGVHFTATLDDAPLDMVVVPVIQN